MSKITFIGGGNMATAIAGGLIANGTTPGDIAIVDPNVEQRNRLQETLGVAVFEDVGEACKNAELIILAVKPQIVPEVADQVKEGADLGGKMLLSIVAGVTIKTLEDLFGNIAIARTMPNTPALLGLGATGLYLSPQTSDSQRMEMIKIIEAFGICVTVKQEELLNAVTAVSGSGPAYFFLMIEEMIKTSVKLGLSSDEAKKLTLQTALGAATMASNGDVEPDKLLQRVTSPNGTTHVAITAMQEGGFGEIIDKAMYACRDRAIELGKG